MVMVETLPSISFPISFSEILSIQNTRQMQTIKRTIFDVAHTMPEPRVYVCEPPPNSESLGAWEVAYDLTLGIFRQDGYSVIDSWLLQTLSRFHPTIRRVTTEPNPYLSGMLDKGLIHTVCLPANLDDDSYAEMRSQAVLSPNEVILATYAVLFE